MKARKPSAWRSSAAPVEAPLRTLANNAGREGALIVQEVKKRRGNEGYNVEPANSQTWSKAGVFDPTKVARSALQNAASISGLLLTTEAVITEAPEKEKAAACPAAAERAGWVTWAEWTTKPSSYSLTKAINNSRVPQGARLFCFVASHFALANAR